MFDCFRLKIKHDFGILAERIGADKLIGQILNYLYGISPENLSNHVKE